MIIKQHTIEKTHHSPSLPSDVRPTIARCVESRASIATEEEGRLGITLQVSVSRFDGPDINILEHVRVPFDPGDMKEKRLSINEHILRRYGVYHAIQQPESLPL